MDKKDGIKPFTSLLLSTNISKVALTLGLLGSIASIFVGLLIPLFTKELIDNFSMDSISTSFIILIIVAFILQGIIDGFSTYMLTAIGQKIISRLREFIWLKVLRLPVSYFDENSTGEIISRVVNDTGVVKDLISHHFPQFISGIISIIGAVSILLIMDWKMTLLMLVSVPVTVFIMIPLGNKMKEVSRGLQDETAIFTGNIQQTLSEIRLMKASTAESVEKKQGITGIHKMLKFGLKEAQIVSLISPIMYLVMTAVIVGVIGYGGVRVVDGSLSTGSLVAFLLYLFQIIMPVTTFTMFFTQLQKATAATSRIIEILELPQEMSQIEIEIDISDKPVRVLNICFSYHKHGSVLKDISFTAQPGEKIAFVGPSGGGKTTLFSLLERYYEPNSGDIKIGNTPIKDISLKSWRSQIGYVSQENSMITGTIRDNLLYGLSRKKNTPDEILWKVIQMAYSDQFIIDFPEGLDTTVGERGMNLSMGQKQRINIARAFLRDPKILLLDEATASLDSQSELIVQEALLQLMTGRTTFIIAHRLSTILDADKIIFIEKGEITGSGSHQDLLQHHALYREFVEQQTQNIKILSE
ncbi:ABC transporter ATP-binding protein [Oceanobacillus sp. J11TS1]|uniref:ABC transporter ATP-binding protein n=1 Tax=Oceanobacillus sp. J11TS1 TaxID=2807191 RepID=UPI001B120FFC|nr:ABC transporter ATP-binding protein [Oceanobacillus sp. J11TS1]GIO22991.1 ABC transporter ATP-binding protein [Oceanobacillus sp. J11TS1]